MAEFPAPMKVVWQYAISDGLQKKLFTDLPSWIEMKVANPFDTTMWDDCLRRANVIVHFLDPIDRATMEMAPDLHLIQKFGVGVDTIDLASAERRRVAVANMPGVNSSAVVEHTLLLILAALRKVRFLDDKTRSGDGWSLPIQTFDTVGELAGRRVGVVGYGAIGARLCDVLVSLGAEVAYSATAPHPDARVEYRELEHLFRSSDVVSLHLPLTAKTEGLVGERLLGLLPSGAVLVNTARGSVVDESALLAALESGQLGGAGLDTFAEEPLGLNSPLLEMPNVVLTPHVAWMTPETFQKGVKHVLENCRRLRAGQELVNRVV